MRQAAVALLLLAAGGCTVAGPRRAGPAVEPRPGAVAAGREGGPPPATTPVRSFAEVRGLWVVRTSLATEEEVRRVAERAAATGFNTLLVQVRGRADAYYDSRWEPRGESIEEGGGFDPLELLVAEGHRRGLAVHAWVNTHLVWGIGPLPRSPDHLVRAHPEWLAVPRDLARDLWDVDPSEPRYVEALHRYAQEHTRTVEGLYTSPSHPAVAERVYSVWMDLLEHYDLDGLHFDYVRYPSAEFDYSRATVERFRRWVAPRLDPQRRHELDEAAATDPLAWVNALPGPWDEFRRGRITGLVERIRFGVRARRPEVVVSAAVFPDADEARDRRFQDWRRWLAEGLVDVVVPMAYTTDDARFRGLVRDARRAAGSRARVWAGIGAYLNGADGTLSKIAVAREEGAGGIVLFSYDWAVSEGSPPGAEPFLEHVGRAAFRDPPRR